MPNASDRMAPPNASERREFAKVQRHMEREAKRRHYAPGQNPARMSKGEYRAHPVNAKDAAPASSGPRGRSTVPRVPGPTRIAQRAGGTAQRATAKARKAPRSVLRFATRTPSRRTLFTEFAVACLVIGVSEVARTKAPPAPGVFLPPVVVFLVLGIAADLGPGPRKVATTFGGLVVLTLMVRHSKGITEGLRVLGSAAAPAHTPGEGKGRHAQGK